MLKLFALVTAFVSAAAHGQINYGGGTYTQDFNGLLDDAKFVNYTNLPIGWVVSHGSYVWTSGSTTNGYSNNYGTYGFASAAGAADKSLGLVIGTTGQAYFGARFRNTSGVALTAFSLSYFEEQWVKGAVTSMDQVIPFSYSIGATSLTSGSYSNFPALDMHSINDGDGTQAPLDGNAPGNRRLISAIVSGISWAANQDLWIRWSGVPYSFFSAHAMAVDDLSFSAGPQLQIVRNGSTELTVSWPTNAAGFVLKAGPDSSVPTWEFVTNPAPTVGDQFMVTIAATNTQRFFRLEKQ
jgi:hypothetical protein